MFFTKYCFFVTSLNHFLSIVSFWPPWKHHKTEGCMGESKGTLGRKGLNTLIDTFGKNRKKFLWQKNCCKQNNDNNEKKNNWTPVKAKCSCNKKFFICSHASKNCKSENESEIFSCKFQGFSGYTCMQYLHP